MCETLGPSHWDSVEFLVLKQGHTASMTDRVQRSYGLGWEGKADHLPVPEMNLHKAHKAKAVSFFVLQ